MKTWSSLVGAFLCLAITNRVSARVEEDWTDIADCLRDCDGLPRTCYTKLYIERLSVLGPGCGRCDEGVAEDCLRAQCVTADGFKRAIIAVNRQLPGPKIEVCRNDTLYVDIVNQMADLSTSVHWHGIRQIGLPYFDGVPYVTQCPILPATTFRYQVNTTIPGTFFYHSHTGPQKLDGLSGPLIIRDIKQYDIHSDLYDEDLSEHILFISDWTHTPAEHLAPGFHDTTLNKAPKAILINGRGNSYDKSSSMRLPLAEFTVEKGKRYRFRLISNTCQTCAVGVDFEGHSLTAITADGGLTFQATQINTVYMNSADRFDVILNADQAEGIYKIHLYSVGAGCAGLHQYALLRYKGATSQFVTSLVATSPNQHLVSTVLNDVTSSCNGQPTNILCLSNLKGTENAPKIEDPELYQQIEIRFGINILNGTTLFRKGNYMPYDEPMKGLYTKPCINKISFMLPPSPLLTQLADIPPEALCSADCTTGNSTEICHCATFTPIKLNSVVDVIIIDEDKLFAHPFHLHGYNVFIMEMKGGFINTTAAVEDVKGRLRRDQVPLNNRAKKDTISVPYGGYTVIRFLADNPGYWILHCHFAFHLEGGMASVFKVGEASDFPPVPNNFPRCGNFL